MNAKVQQKDSDDAKSKWLYVKSFEVFCEYVKNKLIESHDICYMSRLRDEFVKTVRNVESEDASSYRTYRLKERLKERFPQLVFSHYESAQQERNSLCGRFMQGKYC